MELMELPSLRSLMTATAISAVVWGVAIVAFIIY